MKMKINKIYSNNKNLFLLFGILFVFSFSMVGALSYSSMALDRDISMGFTSDDNSVIGLEPGDEINANNENDLVEVTNNFDGTYTFTVILQNEFSDVANIVQSGDVEYEFTLEPGESETVVVDVDGGEQGTDIEYQVLATNGVTEATMDREDGEVTTAGGGGGGGGGGEEPPEFGIELSNDGAVGGSGQYDISWQTSDDLEEGHVDIFVNDELEFEEEDLDGDLRDNFDTGDEIRAEVIQDGESVASDTIFI